MPPRRERSKTLSRREILTFFDFWRQQNSSKADLWQQYNELAGIQDGEVPGGTGNPAYTNAIKVLDGDMDQYIHDNTDDEITHAAFLNAYLTSKGAEPVNSGSVSYSAEQSSNRRPAKSADSPI